MTDDPIRQVSKMLDDLDALLVSPPPTDRRRMVYVTHPRQWEAVKEALGQITDDQMAGMGFVKSVYVEPEAPVVIEPIRLPSKLTDMGIGR